VIADPTRWKQILFNLASNALKFTELGSVNMAVRYDLPGERLVCTFTDTGIGISREHQANLFRPFSQADSSVARKYGGTGLGLYLVSQLAARMGGAVTVDSSPGSGSVFEVAIVAPLAQKQAWLEGAPPLPPRVSASATRDPFLQRLSGHVLLAEDGRDNQTLICAFLHGIGMTYEVVDDGAAAVQAALAGNFDLVLMDIQMPVMDGVRATEVLRATGYARPIVALTANVMPEDVQRYARAGCDSTVGKPINMTELVETLGRMLGKSSVLDVLTSFEDLDGYREIQASYQETLGERIMTLSRGIEQERWGDVATLAHMLKGSAGSFGFPGVTREMALVETAAMHSDRQGAHRAFAQLIDLREVQQLNIVGVMTWQV
jgi:CheY-like chemotaxis protein